jgi:DNA-binding MarR family transcriptional regulator
MKDLLNQLHKAFDNKTRLGIMSVLVVSDRVDFKSLKELLGETDGNLATHIGHLENAGFVEIHKQFIGKRPNTSYTATPTGREAFSKHLSALEELIRRQ